jgi:hypothetical protein
VLEINVGPQQRSQLALPRAGEGGDGVPSAVWVFDGPLWADETDVSMAGGIDRLPQWLEAQLGPSCVQVDVEGYVDKCAIVRATFAR